MGLEYYTFEDASMRLDNTICFYDGHPYRVRSRSASARPNWVTLHSTWGNSKFKPFEVNYTDPKFVYKPTEVGYVNYSGRAYYVSRTPSRIQRQGLSSEVLHVMGGGISPTDLITMKCFEDCLLNKYPSFDEAVSILTKDIGYFASVAFHKHLAIGYLDSGDSMFLYHRGQTIGIKGDNSSQFLLLNGKSTKYYDEVFKNYGVCINV